MATRRPGKRQSKQTTMNISMRATQRSHVEKAVRDGDFANASEFIRHLIREHQEQCVPGWLEDKIEDGLKGPFEVADEKWWAARTARLEANIARNEANKTAKSGNVRGGKNARTGRRAA